MYNIQIDQREVNKIAERLGKWAEEALPQKERRKIYERHSQKLIDAAQNNISGDYETGNLRDSIGVIKMRRNPGDVVYVGPRVRGRFKGGKPWHAALIEYGFTHSKDGKFKRRFKSFGYMRRAYQQAAAQVLAGIMLSFSAKYKKAIRSTQYQDRTV